MVTYTNFTVVVFDVYGNRKYTGGESVTISLQLQTRRRQMLQLQDLVVDDNMDGTYGLCVGASLPSLLLASLLSLLLPLLFPYSLL